MFNSASLANQLAMSTLLLLTAPLVTLLYNLTSKDLPETA